MRRVQGLLLSFIVASSLTAFGQNPAKASAAREQLFPNASLAAVKPALPNAPSYQPLTPKQKLQGFVNDASSPYVFGGALITSITWQWSNRPPFGTGNMAFAQGFGAAVAQREASLFLSRFVIPTALHQDPRYFPAPEGLSNFHRATYAASRVVLTRADSGGQTWNGSYILGNLGSAGLANLYINDRDAATIFSDFAVGMGTDAGYNILREFWPAMRKHVPGKRVRQLGDLVIGLGDATARQGTANEDKSNPPQQRPQK